MLQFRLKAYKRFLRKPIPKWGGGGALEDIDFDDIYYYIKPTEEQAKDWDMVPDSIKETYEKLGIPRGRAQVSRRRDRPIRVGGGLPPQP